MTTENEDIHEGFLGISRKELEAMNDLELAQYQEGWKLGSARNILAEKEWQRRISVRMLHEQFSLDTKLADATNKAMKFAALIGVAGALLGSALGAYVTYATSTGSIPVVEKCLKSVVQPAHFCQSLTPVGA